ncbi:MAG: hypothetical protein QME96_07975, partial [Myxococcota bacterium]|nr:hypothetical protein [Myxococcota bacterium]
RVHGRSSRTHPGDRRMEQRASRDTDPPARPNRDPGPSRGALQGAAGGMFGYWNEVDDDILGWLTDVGLSLKFDVFGTPSPAAGPG